MTNKELTLTISDSTFSVIMQNSFFEHSGCATPLHMHTYPELHVCTEGSTHLLVDGEQMVLEENEMLVIPGRMYHLIEEDPTVKRLAFQISLPFEDVKRYRLTKSQTEVLVHEIKNYVQTKNEGSLSAALAYILSLILGGSNGAINDISDRSFKIHDFFMFNYSRQVSLSDLAKELNLSEKQAARSVRKYFGKSFSEELTKRRMEAAFHLRETTDISLQDIAAQVGYLSYSGFWKAYKSFENRD